MGKNLDELRTRLGEFAKEYPEQSLWSESLAQLCFPAGAAQGGERVQVPPSRCICCERNPPLTAEGLCGSCGSMFEVKSARVASGKCWCGHEAEGSVVYLFRTPDSSKSLCGIGCARVLWEQTFAPFLRRTHAERG